MKSQLSQLQKKQTLLRIFIFTLVTVIIWVGLTLFRTQKETGIRPALISKAEPLNPNINIEIIDQIEQKRVFSDADLNDFPIYSVFTTKNGEEQMVVFSANDKTKRNVTTPGTENSTETTTVTQPPTVAPNAVNGGGLVPAPETTLPPGAF